MARYRAAIGYSGGCWNTTCPEQTPHSAVMDDFFLRDRPDLHAAGTHGAWRARMRTISGALAMSAASTPALPFDPATVPVRSAAAPAQPGQHPPPLATALRSRRDPWLVVPGVPRRPGHRGDRASSTDPHPALGQAGPLPVPEDRRRSSTSPSSPVCACPSLGSYLGPELVSGGRNLILQGKSGRGKIAPGHRHRLPRHPERLHRSLRHRRRADRESVRGQPARQIAGATRSLPAAARSGHRRGWATYPTDRTPPTSCSTSSTNATSAAARCCSPPTSLR